MTLRATASGFDDIVVTSSSKGITDAGAITSIDGNAHMARIEHVSGGKCFWHTGPGVTISDTGGQGEGVLAVGDVIEVWGNTDMTNWAVILQSGAASATLSIQLYGQG
jgi:hypothetical protein